MTKNDDSPAHTSQRCAPRAAIFQSSSKMTDSMEEVNRRLNAFVEEARAKRYLSEFVKSLDSHMKERYENLEEKIRELSYRLEQKEASRKKEKEND